MTLPAFAAERRAAAPLLLGTHYRSISPANGHSAANLLLLLSNEETNGYSTIS